MASISSPILSAAMAKVRRDRKLMFDVDVEALPWSAARGGPHGPTELGSRGRNAHSRASTAMSMRLDLDELFPDEELRKARIRLREHWHRIGHYGDRTIADQCAFAAERFAGTRLVFTSREHPATLSLAELWRRARRLAAVLAAKGVRPGDVCAVQLP